MLALMACHSCPMLQGSQHKEVQVKCSNGKKWDPLFRTVLGAGDVFGESGFRDLSINVPFSQFS